jgi:hypothetical protein
MKYRSIVATLVSGAAALLALGGHAEQQKSQARNANAGSLANEAIKAVAGEEVHQTYQLADGAHVDVSHISGPVSVEATDGQSAEVHIYRSAKNSDDLAYRKVIVERTASGLSIRQKMGDAEPSKINLLNRVVLKLPRRVNLSAKNISGDFNVSGIGGAVDLQGISGSVEAKHLNGAFTVSNASGDVRLAAVRVTGAGLRVSNVSGDVYLHLAGDVNAELSINNTTGGVSNKMSGLALNKVDSANYYARLGSGGPRIVVSNVTGTVVLQRI